MSGIRKGILLPGKMPDSQLIPSQGGLWGGWCARPRGHTVTRQTWPSLTQAQTPAGETAVPHKQISERGASEGPL